MNTEHKPGAEERESNNYGIVESYLTYSWICPECRTINRINPDEYVHNRGVDECIKCERAVNVMAPELKTPSR